jgi:hypothetical protein
MTKMNPEIKAMWVAALRSGDYKQGRELLKEGNQYCCLGVLCDLFKKEAKKKYSFMDLSADDSETPGPEVCIWAALPSDDPTVQIGRRRRLSRHNDGSGTKARTFAEIADAIEAQL